MFIPDLGSEFFSYPGHRFRIPDPEVNKAMGRLHIYLFFISTTGNFCFKIGRRSSLKS